MRRRTRDLVGVLGTLCLVFGATGCGGGGLPEGFGRAFGTVTLDGKPLVDAGVTFHSENGDSFGRTDQEGRYEMQRTTSLQGVDLGPTVVRITTNVVFPDMDAKRLGLKFDSGIQSFVREELVPAKYNRRSELHITVTTDGAPYNFELQSK